MSQQLYINFTGGKWDMIMKKLEIDGGRILHIISHIRMTITNFVWKRNLL